MTTSGEAPHIAQARLAAIVASSQDAIVSKTTEGIVRTWNAAAERMFGYTEAEMVGQSIRILIPEDRAAEEDEILAKIIQGERIENFETVRQRKDGSQFSVSVTVSPIHDADGNIVGASKIARDISELHATLHSLRENEAMFRSMADNISQLAWMADETGYVFWYNQRWYDYTGTNLEQMKGWGWRQVQHPDHVDRVVEKIQHCFSTGDPWEDTFPLRSGGGTYRWFLSRAQPIHDDFGRIVRWFGSNTDITERMESEERINLLLAEVNHRSKNLLALLQAIAQQTAGAQDSPFVERFTARLQSLAASQDVLVSSRWRGAKLERLVRSQLAHFGDLIGNRILLDGPDIDLSPSASQTLGMALHELATNAGKYGALSNETGEIHIRWQTDTSADPERFEIEWAERKGPPVSAPERTGFGASVIERMSSISLSGEVEFSFRPEGLYWRLGCPLDRLVGKAGADVGTQLPLSSSDLNPASRWHVLLVEDEPILAMDLSETLTSAGYTVVGPASSVEHALKFLIEYPCDLCLLDVHLGEETSAPIAEKLIETETPFIVLSGYSQDQLPAVFRGAPHVSKPLRASAVVDMLASLLPEDEAESSGE